MMATEDRSELIEQPRRASPLPWMLLVVALAAAVGIFVIGRVRINDERLRTASALKADDEVMGRLRAVAADYAKSQLTITELETRNEMLMRQVKELDAKSKALSSELYELRKKKK